LRAAITNGGVNIAATPTEAERLLKADPAVNLRTKLHQVFSNEALACRSKDAMASENGAG
jgi:hypothetical protein